MDLGSLLGGLADDEQGKGKEGDPADQLSDLLGSLLGGAGAQGSQPAQNPPLQGGDEVLGSLSGSIGDAPMMGQGRPPAGAPAGGDLGDLLGDLMGNAGGQGGQGRMPQGGSGDPMSDLLGSVLGGGGSPQMGGQANDPMSDLLGSVLGGGGGSPQMGGQANDPIAGMLGGLLGGVLGGGMGGASAGPGAAGNMGGLNSALAPLANSLADKIGIPREIAMAAVTIIVPMVMSKLMNSGQGGDTFGSAGKIPRQGLSFTPDEETEMVHQLTAQTGMDEASAQHTLNQAVRMLAAQ